ncbi:Cathepsin L-like cysteine proteinase [Aphelenchoides fujianensis]|nr:Cathepsin L-like cysteine proteinase [Aphelenchoides fujianensis]
MRLERPSEKAGTAPLIPEYKLRPFHAYRDFLARVALTCAVLGVISLAFLVIATNLPLKDLEDEEEHGIPDRIEPPQFARDVDFDEHYESFKKFMYKFGRRYETFDEMNARFSSFRKTLKHVEKLNHLEELTSTKFGVNELADLHEEEFKQMLLPKDFFKNLRSNSSFIKPMPKQMLDKAAVGAYPYPEHFDWREKGVVTPVKAQGKCGSCWAFACAATVETSYAIQHGELRNLSEQELLDCNLDNNACNGGDEDKAFRFVHDFGLMLEDEYPYVAHRQNSCALHDFKGNTTKIDLAYFINPDENAIIEWLVTFGPVNVGISVPSDMKPYTGGVYRPSDWACQFDVLGLHALNIVGYGTSEDGEKYWIVKNSWGQNWGIEDGYIYFARGVNACGIEDEPIGLLA